MKRKICVVTGTRAEFGLMYWMIKFLEKEPAVELQLIVTGMHLSPEFGSTYNDIENSGFKINKKLKYYFLLTLLLAFRSLWDWR